MIRRLLIIAAVFSVVSLLAYYTIFAPRYLRTYHSPDGQYRLELYERPKWFSMPGDGGTKCAQVKLYKGIWRIWDNCERCPTFTHSVDVMWEMDKNRVWFAKPYIIDLETGDCSN